MCEWRKKENEEEREIKYPANYTDSGVHPWNF